MPILTRRALLPSALLALALSATTGRAQATLSADDANQLRASLLGDLETMRGKFVGLADAFPQDKYTWRPMEGVRSVSEVLMLAAFEGYSFIPNSLGGKPADLGGREAAAKLRQLTDKAQIIEHINKGFAHAKAQIEGLDAATLASGRNLFGQNRSATAISLLVFGDLHEHLGQLIAYARMNQIVPPWSKKEG
ncbi:MAG: hypothetical protein U0163_08520 [Gemmatimonadaceae bacterium]